MKKKDDAIARWVAAAEVQDTITGVRVATFEVGPFDAKVGVSAEVTYAQRCSSYWRSSRATATSSSRN
jgi:hypothetical protein